MLVRKCHYVSPFTESDLETYSPSAMCEAARRYFSETVHRCIGGLQGSGLKKVGININFKYFCTHLRFADDIVVIAETIEDISAILNDLSRVSERVGLKMNMEKTMPILYPLF